MSALFMGRVAASTFRSKVATVVALAMVAGSAVVLSTAAPGSAVVLSTAAPAAAAADSVRSGQMYWARMGPTVAAFTYKGSWRNAAYTARFVATDNAGASATRTIRFSGSSPVKPTPKLDAYPYVVTLPLFSKASATGIDYYGILKPSALITTNADVPLSGRTIDFYVPQTPALGGGTIAQQYICTATSGANGWATCTGTIGRAVDVILTEKYEARFAGDGQYGPVTDKGALIGTGAPLPRI